LLAGLTGIGIWAASYSGAAVFQNWQNFAFECLIQGDEPTFLHYLADRGKRLVASAEAWCGVRPEPSTLPAPIVVPRAHLGRRTPRDGLIGRLVIPRLYLGEIVREGDGEDTLTVALGHIPGTALPSQGGNVGVAGHRDTLFQSLRSIGKNDRIQFQTIAGSYNCQVESIDIVKPGDVRVLAPDYYSQLTLVTCYPFLYIGPAPDRLIVKARQVSP